MSENNDPSLNNTECYEDEFARIWIENGICHYRYKPGVYIDYQTQVRHTRIRNGMSENKPLPLLSDSRGVKYWSAEARKYSNSEEGTRNISAVAIIVNSAIQRTIWNWAVKFLSIKTPARLFTIQERDNALAWLEKFRS